MFPTSFARASALLLITACAGPGPRNVSRENVHETALDWTLGEWVGTRRAAADGSVHPIRVVVTPILGGAGQLRELWVDHEDGTYRGMSIQLRDAGTGQWTRYYANDVTGLLVALRAAGDVGGPVGVWRSGPNESGRWSENRSEHPDPERWISTVSRTTDGGASWQVVFVDELERVSAAASNGARITGAGRGHPGRTGSPDR